MAIQLDVGGGSVAGRLLSSKEAKRPAPQRVDESLAFGREAARRPGLCMSALNSCAPEFA